MRTSRRLFLRQMLLGSATVAATPLLFCESTRGHKLENIGFISGIIGKELKVNWREALSQAVSFGFTEYEGGLQGDSPAAFLDFCRQIGLKPVAGGVQFSEDMDVVQQSYDRVKALEMTYAVTYWPWFSGGPFTLEDCKKSVEVLNKMGTLAESNDLVFCWHNHDKEFHAMEEGLPFHYLMENTDESLVRCEMDIYWVKKGGENPLEILKQYAGRIPLLHVKDMAPGEEQDFACPGSGIINFAPIFAEAYRQGIKHYFVERDNVPDGIACLQSSSEYLRNLRF
ncbi:sugar phosphate isomerase/epimerase [candidate division KSB1 bacterium]|nr:sugar phosphate isomerase/epimerase [candidate division KSB1 bacterium]